MNDKEYDFEKGKAIMTKTEIETEPLYKEIAAKGYDWRGVIGALQCSRQEFRWWQEDGRFPPPDGEVLSHTFTSMSRAYNHMDDGWLPETIEKVKPYIEKWRADYQATLKSRRNKKNICRVIERS